MCQVTKSLYDIRKSTAAVNHSRKVLPSTFASVCAFLISGSSIILPVVSLVSLQPRAEVAVDMVVLGH